MDDPQVIALAERMGVKFLCVREMNLGSIDCRNVRDSTGQAFLRKVHTRVMSKLLADIKKIDKVKKFRVVQDKGGESSLALLSKEDHSEKAIIYLLPQEPEPTVSKNQNAAAVEQILVIVRHHGWQKPLYLGFGFYDLYLRWWLGDSCPFAFKGEFSGGVDTFYLQHTSKYDDLVGSTEKLAKIQLNCQFFGTSLHELYHPETAGNPEKHCIAAIILYFAEALRFRAIRNKYLLFQLKDSKVKLLEGYAHNWQVHISHIVNHWGQYSKQLFLKDSDGQQFYKNDAFCKEAAIRNRLQLDRVLSVACHTDEAKIWSASYTEKGWKRKQE